MDGFVLFCERWVDLIRAEVQQICQSIYWDGWNGTYLSRSIHALRNGATRTR